MISDDAGPEMSEAVRRAFERLRREYLDEMPARLAELEAAIARDDDADIRMRLHQLAGSGGSHGFPGISEAARVTGPRQALGALREAVTEARKELG